MCDRNGPLCQPHPLCPLGGFTVKMKDRSSEIIIEYFDFLPADFTDAAAKSLLDLKKRIAAKGGQPPRALVVVIGLAGAAYRRRDGVYVIPVTALRP